ncbi:MAG TPA: amidohydrolase family protein [Gammaproteobacteria bacterium]
MPGTSRGTAVALGLFVTGAAPALDVVKAPYKPDSGNLAVHCGTLIDGVSDAPVRDRVVVIRSGHIQAVVPPDESPADLPKLHLFGYTCLPGLIDMHVHIADRSSDTKDLSIYFRRTDAEQGAISQENARTTLLAGFTSVRSVGAYIPFSEQAIQQRIEHGEAIGPRIQAAGIYLTVPGGGGDLLIPGIPEADIPARVRSGVARGPEQFAEKARFAEENGAEVLKVIASGAVLAYGGIPGAPEMTPEEIRAVVKEGHNVGLLVTAHAHGAQSIKDAISAGVDCIEHASLADDEAVRLAAERQVCFSMDIYNGDWIATVGREEGWPEEFIRKNDETTEAQRQAFTKAWRAGVPIVYGTDAAVYPHGLNARQFRIMVERGMPPMEAIKSATSRAAHHLGWGGHMGRLAAGYFGDLIAVRRDPVADITELERVAVVIKGGLPFKLPECQCDAQEGKSGTREEK